MKKMIALLLTLVLLLTVIPSALAAPLRGDTSGEGTINAKDVTVLRRYLAGGYGIEMDERVGDTNADSSVNAKDVTYLRRYLAGGYNATLEPIPEDKRSYADGVTGGQLYTDLGEPEFGEGKYSLRHLVDGEEQGDALKAKLISGNTDAIAPVGSVTEAEVDEGTKTVTISTSKYYAAQIEAVHPAEGSRQAYITLKQFDDNEVPAGEVTLADSTTVTKAFITDAFNESDVGDFVAYTKADGLVQTAEPAEAKMGKITTGGVTATTVAMDGVTYKLAASAKALSAGVGAAVGICLDPNGNVLCTEKIFMQSVNAVANDDDQVSTDEITNYDIFLAAAKADREKGDPRTMPVEVPQTIKLLVIGNSFGNDSSLQYLSSEFKALGIENVVVGTLYYSGCPYSRHLRFALQDSGVYDFYKNGSTVHANTCTFDEAIMSEDWTHIMMLSGYAYRTVDFGPAPWQDLLLYYLRRTHPNAYYGYDMTWPFKADSTKPDYLRYHDGDQMKMYNAAVRDVHTYVLSDERMKFVAPVGTAIQNARTSFIGDHLDRDTYHLNKGIGRYTATLTVCATLTGVDPAQIAYRPDSNLKSNMPEGLSADMPNILNRLETVAKESARNAVAHPYEITQSRYTDASAPTPGENELPVN